MLLYYLYRGTLHCLAHDGQDAQPRAIIPLWKSYLEEHKIQEADPSVVIVDNSPSNFLLLEDTLFQYKLTTSSFFFYLLVSTLLSDLVSKGRRRRRSCHTSWETRSRFRKSKSTHENIRSYASV